MMEGEQLSKVIEQEERKLRGMDKKERVILDSMKDEPLEAGQKIGEQTAPIYIDSGIFKNLDQVLREEGVSPLEIKHPLSSKAKRSKRYYIRNRIEKGKPYIPARIRALGKERARALGYKNWEDRVLRNVDDEITKHNRMIHKLSVILGLVAKTRLGDYFKKRGD